MSKNLDSSKYGLTLAVSKTLIMITNIYSGNSTETIKVASLYPTILFVMVVFDSVQNRDEFAKQFPKSLNVTSSIMTGHKWDDETRKLVRDENGKIIPLFYPFCSVRISEINKKTGESNEAGYKRMNRFYSAILKQYTLEGSVNLTGMMNKYALLKLPENPFK